MKSEFELAHPYARYGLAAALYQSQITPEEMTEENVREALAYAIESGLGNFRLETFDDPASVDVLRFDVIKLEVLRREPDLIQSNGLAPKRGKYLAPSIISLDGKAKDTFTNALECVERLRGGDPLHEPGSFTLSRSFAPLTKKFNNGTKSQRPPKSTLFEAACTVITTVTKLKPAAWLQQPPNYDAGERVNTGIIPDLPLNELRDFIELFESMMIYGLKGDMLEAKIQRAKSNADKKAKSKKTEDADSKKPGFKRPRIFDGNYPFAPRFRTFGEDGVPAAMFGVVGLVAAIGRWSLETKQRDWAQNVLTSIAGAKDGMGAALYSISYTDFPSKQYQFANHVVKLALNGELSSIIDGFAFDTRLYNDLESIRPSFTAREHEASYKMLHFMASRFLQQWSLSAFSDFFAIRAEYSPKLQPLFEVYFMETREIDKATVESAKELGQWLNRIAFFAADEEVEASKPNDPERKVKVQKRKAKYLIEFESAVMSAKTSQDMLHRVSTRAGRLLGQDAPSKATRFMDATASGEISLKEAQHLLIAYMRLRSERTEKLELNAEVTTDVSASTVSLTAIYEEAEEGGYIGYVAELSGANTQGDTLEETRENLIEAALMILEANREEVERRLTESGKVTRERITLRAA